MKRTSLFKRPLQPVEAIYVPSAIPLYRDNPLISALPALRSSSEWKEMFAHRPIFDPAERERSADERLHCVLQLKQLFVVQSRHLQVREKLDMLLRIAYVGVSIDDTERNKRAQSWYETIQSGSLPELGTQRLQSGEFFSLIGSSGLGKTWGVARFKQWIPGIIWHPRYGVSQIPILYALCPHNGSTLDLGLAVLHAFDDILGTSYADEYTHEKEEILISVSASLCDKHCVGLLVIDEIQSISHKKSGGREAFMDFFLQLFNCLHLSIVVIGTMKAVRVLQTTFRQARRASSLGALIWERHHRESKDWERLEHQVWQYQWLRVPTPWSEDIGDALYKETQGITSLLVRLVILVQHRAIRLNDRAITPELIHGVAKDNFGLLKPMLDALRSGDKARIAKFDDFEIPELEDLPELAGYHPRSELVDSEDPVGLDVAQVSVRRRVVESLATLGVPLPTAVMHVDAILKEQPYADALAVQYEALVRIGGKPKPRRPDKPRSSKEEPDTTKSSPDQAIPVGYEALKAKGWIKPTVLASDDTET